MTGRTVSRRQERRAAFVLLYQTDLRDGDLDELYRRYEADTGEAIPPYTREVVDGVVAHLVELDAAIDRSATGWSAERIGAVERAILRLALWELQDRDDVPAAVSIDEAVQLARRYASPDAARFVNGVLGAAARESGTAT